MQLCQSLMEANDFPLPFRHFHATGALDSKFADAVLRWLEHSAPWTLSDQSFYEQYEIDLLSEQLPAEIASLTAPDFLSALTSAVENRFEVQLACKPTVTAHKLVRGQSIRIHNDFRPGGETHRLLIQLNRHWDDETGGFLTLYASNDSMDVSCLVPPINNSLLVFGISERSFHSVSTVHSGDRYTVVYSFSPVSD